MRYPFRRRRTWRDTVVFVGPTLPADAVRAIAPVRCLPPARMGDVFRAVRSGARHLGIVDGYYERVPAVWHKEILWALAGGVRVFGAASMGAIRAAELDVHGMVGVGSVYRQFRDGTLEDDDEVALFHGPAEGGYAAASEPMVNIRATVRLAVARDILDIEPADRVLAAIKALHYPDRTYDAVVSATRRCAGAAPAERLSAWLPTGAVDVKRRDAEEMVRALACARRDGPPPNPPPFEPTWIWQDLVLSE